MVEPAPAVAGGSVPLPTSSFMDLVRLFLSLSGPVAQQDAAAGSMLSAAGVLPGHTALLTPTAPVAFSSVMPSPGVSTPAGAAFATTSPGRCECARESSRPEKRRRHSSDRERSRSDGKRGKGRSPFPARSARSASESASSLFESSDTEERVSAMPPTPFGRSGVGGGCSVGDHSTSGHDHSPQPGPSGLGLGDRSAPPADRSRSEYRGRSPPPPPPLLRVRQKMTKMVPPVRLIWIGTIRFGLCFTSSGSFTAWRTRQV